MLAGRGRFRHTLASTRLDLLQFGRFLGSQQLQSISTDDLRAYFVWLQGQQGNAAASLRRKTSTLKRAFQFLHSNGVLAEDPSTPLLYPALESARRRVLSGVQADAIVRAAGSPSWMALVTCLVDCGLKRDELLALRWQDVDLKERLVHVRRRQASQRARRRTLALTERLVSALQTHHARSLGKSAVFQLSARGIDFIVEACGRRAGVRPGEKVTPQMLRDAYAIGRVALFVERERALGDNNEARSNLARGHERTLLRELGLSDQSVAATRYRRLFQESQLDRTE